MTAQIRVIHNSLGVASILMCTAVVAQTSQRPLSGPAAAEEMAVQEVVVTAQKREERLQDVPITVEAVTADKVQQLGVTASDDLGNAIPGLMFKKSSAYAAPYLRGIGSVVVAQGDESSVATYVDGVYQVAPSSAMFSFNNIDRIEVLKGPQGTLFGRNANGGVINVITRTPSKDPSVDASVGYGNYNTVDAKFYVTGPVGSRAAVDLAVYGLNQGDGWGHNLLLGSEVYKDQELATRSKLRFELDEASTLTLIGSYSLSRDDRSGAFRLAKGQTSLVGGFTYPGFYNTDSNLPDVSNRLHRADVSLTGDHDLGWASVKSITAYSQQHFTWNYDVDATPLPMVNAFIDPHDKNVSEELQLFSPAGGRVQWIGGLYYLYSKSDFGNAAVTGLALGPQLYSDVRATQTTHSIAGFGQATIELLPELRLTLGGRYTSDERRLEGGIDTGLGAGPPVDKQATFGRFTYRGALDYKLADDVLTYVSVSSGFKSGLYNTTQPYQDVIKPETLTAYEAGIKTQFWDKRAQVNASYFFYRYADLQTNQVSQFNLITVNSGIAHLRGLDLDFNLVPLRHLSVQGGVSYLHAKFVDFPNALYFTPLPTGGYATSQGDATGNSLVRAPQWTYLLNGQYSIDSRVGSWIAGVSFNHTSSFYWDIQNTYREPATDSVNATLTWVAPNSHLELALWGKNLLNQQTNTYVAPTQLGYIALPAAPLTFGGSVRARF